jgi:hypothetical protein
MISLHSVIKKTTPNMKLQNTNSSIMNINNPINSSKITTTILSKNMFQRINLPLKKCDSCPNAR